MPEPLRNVIKVLAWIVLALLVVATLGPISLRPSLLPSVQLERGLAFAILGGLFGLAYPRRLLLIALVLVLAAGLLEAGQLLAWGRHGQFRDFAVKAVGGLLGLAAARLTQSVWAERQHR